MRNNKGNRSQRTL